MEIFDLVTFGELLLRLSAPEPQTIAGAECFQKYLGGSELNVAAGAAQLGLRSAIVSRVPENPLGLFAARRMASKNVSTQGLLFDGAPDARLGVYYSQSGASPRRARVVYDRAYSSFRSITPEMLPKELLSKTRLFHTCGITLALCENVRAAAAACIETCRANRALISFDVNYRESLWGEEEARSTIEAILPLVDVLFVSEESCRRMFRKTGTLREIQKSFCDEYGISAVFSTQRSVTGGGEQSFCAAAYDAKSGLSFSEEPYRNIRTVDRIGSGDAFVAGALYGLLACRSIEQAVAFGDAMAAVKNTIAGDLPETDLSEIKGIIDAHGGKGAVSEMIR